MSHKKKVNGFRYDGTTFLFLYLSRGEGSRTSFGGWEKAFLSRLEPHLPHFWIFQGIYQGVLESMQPLSKKKCLWLKYKQTSSRIMASKIRDDVFFITICLKNVDYESGPFLSIATFPNGVDGRFLDGSTIA